MSNENEKISGEFSVKIPSNGTFDMSIQLPLDLEWNPQEDITTYELAQCIPLLFRHTAVMPYEVDKDAPYMRHFKITDLNR